MLAFISLVVIAKATPPTLEIIPNQSKYFLENYLEVLEDPQGELTFEAVSLLKSGEFKPLSEVANIYEHEAESIWLRFQLRNLSEDQRFLLSFGLIDVCEIYLSNTVKKEGMLTPYEEREHHFGRYPHIELNLYEDKFEEIYIKVKLVTSLSRTNAETTQPIHKIKLLTYDHIEETYGDSEYFLGLHSGIMIIMVLYNLVVFLFIKDRSYLFYILFIVFYLTASATIDGSTFEYIWGNYPEFNIVAVRHALTVAWFFYLLFTQNFLNTKIKLKKWYTALNILMGSQILIFILNVLGIWLNWLAIIQVMMSMVVVFGASITSMVRGYRPAIYYVIANVCLLGIALAASLWGLGFMSVNPFNYYVLQIGMTLQVILFAAGLADRINLIQNKLIDQQNEKRQLIQQQNVELEKRVRERTDELEQKNKALTSQKREIMIQNKELEQQNEEITAQKELIAAQKEAVGKAYQDIKILKEMGRKINSTLDIKEIIRIAYENISKLVTSTAFGIGTVNWEENRIDLIGYFKRGEHFPDYQVPLDANNRLIVWSVMNNKDLIIRDYEAEYETYANQKLSLEESIEKPKSLIYIPLSLKGKVIGILLVQSDQINAFTPTHFDILKSLAEYVTVGINHADAYKQVKDINEQMQIKNTQIIDSLRYAKTIQDAILTDSEKFTENFKEYFIFYRAKDVVSGDFYWLAQQRNKILIAVVDCTGHGVPGAFMSMVGHELLSEIVSQRGITDPSLVLMMLHRGIRKALQQDVGKNDDGMDLSICSIEYVKDTDDIDVIFAGAKSSIFYAKHGEVVEARGDKKSIGGMQREKSRRFTNQKIELKVGDMLYFTTDGYFDQHNIERRKFGKKRFIKQLQDIHQLKVDEQRSIMKSAFLDYKGEQYQRDDITVLGIRL
ncbi:MAG: 7TM diverse intracellular signaling domain-containing protein [Flammeovirgaceae bacterium]